MIAILERYNEAELEAMIRLMHGQLDEIYNPKSKFSVASLLTAQKKDRTMGMFLGGNTEISPRAHSNMCGERNNLHEVRALGRPMRVLDTLVLGKDMKKPPSAQLGRLTPCCHMCLEELYQFRSMREDQPTLIHQIPYFPLTMKDAIQRTIAGIITDSIYDLVPPILRLETDECEKYLLSKKAKGIFHTKTKEELFELIQAQYKELTGEGMVSVPPLNGDITDLVKAAKIDINDINSFEQLSKMNCLLGIMRNIAAWKHFDVNKGCVDKDIHHFDTAISATTDGKFYIGSSLAGVNISAQENGIHLSLGIAKNEDHNHLVSHLFIMGDPITSDHNRLYPVTGEIYEITKRSTKRVLGQNMREPDMHIYCFAPNSPAKDVEPDTRDCVDRLSTEAPADIVVRYNLSELVKSGSTFVTPVEERRAR